MTALAALASAGRWWCSCGILRGLSEAHKARVGLVRLSVRSKEKFNGRKSPGSDGSLAAVLVHGECAQCRGGGEGAGFLPAASFPAPWRPLTVVATQATVCDPRMRTYNV